MLVNFICFVQTLLLHHTIKIYWSKIKIDNLTLCNNRYNSHKVHVSEPGTSIFFFFSSSQIDQSDLDKITVSQIESFADSFFK